MRTLIVAADEQGSRLDRYLFRYFDAASAAFVYKHLRKKNIKLNGSRALGNERLTAGDTIELYFADGTLGKMSSHAGTGKKGGMVQEEKGGINYVAPCPGKEAKGRRIPGSCEPGDTGGYCTIIYEDKYIIIADKRDRVLSQKAKPGDISLNEVLLNYVRKEKAHSGDYADEGQSSGIYTPSVCNRLDKNTSGLVIFAKTYAAAREINRVIKERSIEKYYLALAAGRMEGSRHVCSWLIKDQSTNKVSIFNEPFEGASRIETWYEPIGYADFGGRKAAGVTGKEATILKIRLITGKTHQIRAQLSAMHHPVLGDRKYAPRHIIMAYPGIKRQMLHAWEIVMPDRLGAPLEHLSGRKFTAPVPEDMKTLCLTIRPSGDVSC